ncbi:MAG: glycosyltransferase family 4 protein [Atopobiaceae bacterium]|nr:glycosyltransferase family 4 protein [Atopobiaceae bacterium]
MSEHIVIVSPFYPPHLGGVEQFSQGLARTLIRMGHRATVVTSSEAGEEPRRREDDGVEVVRLPTTPLLGGRFPLVGRRESLATLVPLIESAGISGMLANTRFFSTTACALEAAHRVGMRAVVLDHGSSYIGFGIPAVDWAVRAYERGVTRVVRHYDPDFYGISQMSADWLAHFGIAARGTIHNALDADAFVAGSSGRDFRAELGIGEQTMLVTFSGRLVAAKGVPHLLTTSSLLKGMNCDVRFAVAGDGPERQRLLACDDGRVISLGRLGRADVTALLCQSDLFFFPSEYPEGMPTSILEALACGVPTLATAVGGVRELIPDEDHGMVFERVDCLGFAKQIRWCNEHRDALCEMGRRSAEHVREHFSWEGTARLVIEACRVANT